MQLVWLVIFAILGIILTLEWVGLRWERRWLLWTILIFQLVFMGVLVLALVGVDATLWDYEYYRNDYNDNFFGREDDIDWHVKWSNIFWGQSSRATLWAIPCPLQ